MSKTDRVSLLRSAGLSGARRTRAAAPFLAMAALGLLAFAGLSLRSTLRAEKARAIPAPSLEEGLTQATSGVAVLAGGCFWGVQGVFQHVKGVSGAVSGYAGGERNTARYDVVTRGTSGHAEAVQVTYDPRQISYGKLLRVFFSVVHDPTQLNRQGPDVGAQYRSAIFPASAEQARLAKAYIDQLSQARVFDAAIVTTIELDRPFYPAESYHQDFLKRNPAHPYIVVHDLPKLGDLERVFPDLYRKTPVLVGTR